MQPVLSDTYFLLPTSWYIWLLQRPACLRDNLIYSQNKIAALSYISVSASSFKTLGTHTCLPQVSLCPQNVSSPYKYHRTYLHRSKAK